MTGRRTRVSRIAVVLIFVLMMVAVPAIAQARVLEYQLQFLPVGSGGVSQMIVNVILAPDTELPATVRVPIPAGATVVWSGEIIGDDPALDPYREATVTAVSGGQLVEFVVSESRVAQVEADYIAPTRSGSDVSVTLAWVNAGDAAPLLASVRLEPGASNVKISPAPVGDPISNDLGEKLFALDRINLATGDTLDIVVDYSLGGSDGGQLTTALAIAGGLLIIAVAALVFVVSKDRRRRGVPPAGQAAPTAEDEEELVF